MKISSWKSSVVCQYTKEAIWQLIRVSRFKLAFVVLLSFLLTAVSIPYAADNLAGSKEKPTLFCQVVKEPNPLLVGSWKCTFERRTEEGNYETNPVEYRLLKYGDQYALYFYRLSRNGRKQYIGWRAWTINGDEITSDTGVKIVAKDGDVFFIWQDGKPTKMTRVGN